MELTECREGQRVATHPATDSFMRGDRYGTVVAVGRKFAVVRLDRSQTTRKFHAKNLIDIHDGEN